MVPATACYLCSEQIQAARPPSLAAKGDAMRLIFGLIAMLVAVILAAQNATAVSIDLFAWRITSSLALVIASCFAVGVMVGVLFAMPSLYRTRLHKRRLQTQLAELGGQPAESESPPVTRTRSEQR
jgi:uncharacterized integral membrane protein